MDIFCVYESKLQTVRNVVGLKAASFHKALTTHELNVQNIQGLLCLSKSMSVISQWRDFPGSQVSSISMFVCVCVYVCVCVCARAQV
jgi:hypothetical protein